MQFKAKVTVMFRKSILDPQGAAVERALKAHEGGADISSVRVGKVIDLTLDGPDAESVEKKVRVLADRLLANPVMEEYTVHVEPLP
jgi:phosphoribosylformylglycinamidine synthase